MNAEVAKAHSDTLLEWADQYERSSEEGASEVAFLLRRAARMAARIAGAEALPPEPRTEEPSTEEPRLDETVPKAPVEG